MSQKKIEENDRRIIIPVPQSLLNNIFQLILDRRFSEAEMSLEEIEARFKEEGYDEFKRGFIQALRGIILTYRSNDQDIFLNVLDSNNSDALKKCYEEFLKDSRNRLHGDYDRGFFLALANYIHFMLKRAGSSRRDNIRSEGKLE